MKLGLVAVCLVGCSLVLLSEWYNSRTGKWLTKPFASLAFIAVALMAGAWDSHYGIWILSGLCLSWLGDLLLIPKERKEMFLAGIGSFLLAHVAYSIAFLSLGFDLSALSVAGIAGFLVALLLCRWLVVSLSGLFVFFVPLYIAVIMVMVVCAVNATSITGAWYLFVGALLFAVSDISVARDRFISAGFINRIWGLPLYYIAQLMLAWTAGLH